MNLNEIYLFKYCKSGDLTKLKLLIDKESLNLNLRDKWDSTPLYYACLCGHLEVVEFLLDNGARCEANTFDGERCLYGALTDQIRNVLKNYKINTTKLDQYDLHLERLFEIGMHSDITFEIKERSFKAHKFILSARSEYFREKFENKWRKRTWILGRNQELIPEAFESVLKYIYTGRFSTPKVYFKSCLRLVKLFKLNELLEKFQNELFNLRIIDDDVKLDRFDFKTDFDDQKVVHESDMFIIGKFGIHSKLNSTISILCQSKISKNFKNLVFYCLPDSLKPLVPQPKGPNFEQTIYCTHDMKIILEDNLKFCVHKAFVEERCDFFRAFLNDPFNELKSTTESNDSIQMSTIHLKEISKEVLIEIIHFIYCDEFSKKELGENILVETLISADLYMLSSLKRKCAAHLANHLNNENVFDFLRLARLYELKKLEFSCITHIANNLIELEESEELKDIIVEDAKNLKMRQETDSIDIVDDLRYAINENYLNLSHVKSKVNSEQELSSKLAVIDKILSQLNLIC